MSPRRLGGALEQFSSFDWYHLLQTGIDTFELNIFPNEKYDCDEEKLIDNVLRDILGNDVKLKINTAGKLLRARTGKMRAIESKVSSAAQG